ncbi:hypothetical protein [uncultured Eubacterium sp.]|nr:hypothetical protein [uncultured Eubacterium sp.]
MNPKILTFIGLGLTLAGTIVSTIAGNQVQQMAIDEAINAKFAQLQK